MRVVKGYGKPLSNRSDVEEFVRWMQAKPLANRTIAGILQVCRNGNPSNRQLFTYRLTLKQRSVQSDVLSVEEIGMVLRDLAMGNSPADLAQIAGHSTEMLLKTYAQPTGRVKLPSWS